MPRPIALAVLACVAGLIAPATAAAFDTEGYFRLADQYAARLAPAWSPADGYYASGSPALDSRLNAAMLVVHATAARFGHQGASRDDARARRLAQLLTGSPPFFSDPAPPGPDPMFHTPGWLGNLVGGYTIMDKAIDPKIAEGLAAAWEAREILGLDPATAEAIPREIAAVANGPFFRFPNVRLNQINWPLELDAYAAQVTGDASLLREQYPLQMDRFLADGRNLSPSYRFQYLPHRPASHFINYDSAEYANIVLHFLAFYGAARRAGMPEPAPQERAILRGWVRRALFGYWTHSGMLNWDTGLALKRWMKGKTWAYAQQGLLAIASAARFQADPRYRPWAKAMLDRGLELGLTFQSSNLYGVRARRRARSDDLMFAARMAANAARAADAGLGHMPTEEPPPFFAYDPDVGRLAISTPRYSTAVVPINRNAFQYGGIELARLLDGEGRPLSGIGGEPPNTFGIVVRDRDGNELLASQRAGRRPLKIRAPRRPGPFRVIEAAGTRRSGEFAITTRHRFTRDAIEETWTVRRLRGRRDATVVLQLPSWGIGAQPRATGPRRLALSGYDVRLTRTHGPIRRIATTPQSSDPQPGPTLELTLAAGRRFRTTTIGARITIPSATTISHARDRPRP